jgi:hypothetical protein
METEDRSQHHLRLYIYSFSLQGHMQRADSCNGGQRPSDYFPSGLMGSVDARFIIEAMNAAVRAILEALSMFDCSHFERQISYVWPQVDVTPPT